jgi:cbb3-type cytochrome oxidase subunit 3
MKKIKNFFLTFLALIFIAAPTLALAQSDNASSSLMGRLSTIGKLGGYNTSGDITVSDIVGIAIRGVITLLGLVFIVLILLAGFKWMRAEGNEEEIKKANRTIKESIIGLIITLSAWTIWSFVFEKLILGQ